jgi:hypothetical protein
MAMHYKTKNKLKTAKKIYTVVPQKEKATEIRFQLPDHTYVQFNLNLPFPKTVNYISLEHGGFNYDPAIDTPIVHYPAKKTINILRNSIDYRNNDRETIEEIIKLIESIPHPI